jgi:cob(I)alamin adenosyltransferase
MTESEIVYIKSALERLAEQVDDMSDNTRESLGKIYDRLTVLETTLAERQKICQYHETLINNHEKRLHRVEQNIGKLEGMPEKLWKIALQEAQTSAGFAMYLKLGGVAGAVGGMIVSAMILVIKTLNIGGS